MKGNSDMNETTSQDKAVTQSDVRPGRYALRDFYAASAYPDGTVDYTGEVRNGFLVFTGTTADLIFATPEQASKFEKVGP